jgi:hypothetical protein
VIVLLLEEMVRSASKTNRSLCTLMPCFTFPQSSLYSPVPLSANFARIALVAAFACNIVQFVVKAKVTAPSGPAHRRAQGRKVRLCRSDKLETPIRTHTTIFLCTSSHGKYCTNETLSATLNHITDKRRIVANRHVRYSNTDYSRIAL